VPDEHIQLDERTLVDKRVNPFAGSHLSRFVLLVDGALAPSLLVFLAQ